MEKRMLARAKQEITRNAGICKVLCMVPKVSLTKLAKGGCAEVFEKSALRKLKVTLAVATRLPFSKSGGPAKPKAKQRPPPSWLSRQSPYH